MTTAEQEFRIVRLQIQTGPMKIGTAPWREYRTDGLQQVDRLHICERGSRGEWNGSGPEPVEGIDVHHRDHPSSRDRKGKAGLTVMGTGDYLQLRERYGSHLVDGTAGESVLVDAPDGLAEIDFPQEFRIRTENGPLHFRLGRVADPCVEFSRFCLGEPPSDTVTDAVQQALTHLDRGHRGYRAAAAASGTITCGDRLVLPAR